MSSKPKILVIIPNLDYGGAQVSFSKLCNDLNEFFCVFPCVYTLPEEIPYSFKISPIVLSKNYSGLIGKFFKLISVLLKLKRLKKTHQVVASISFMESANYLNVLSSRGENTIISHRGSYLNDKYLKSKFAKIRLNLLMPMLFGRATNNVCVSTALAEEVVDNYRVSPKKISVIHNYYDLELLVKKSDEPIPERYFFLKNKNYLVTVGRLHPQKGYSALLKLFSSIQNRLGNCLVIIGSGDLLQSLVKECNNLNLTSKIINDDDSTDPSKDEYDVYFLGFVKNALPIVKQASLFLLTSYWEGFPNVVIEAMAAKTLVLASDCPTGPSEILTSQKGSIKSNHENAFGVLLPLLNSSADFDLWKESILKYTKNSDDKHRMIQEGFESLDRFSRSIILSKWREVVDGS